MEESTVVAPTVKNLISEKSADLRDHFPFNTIRENQNETLDKLAIWNKSNKKFFILEAATGFGKSPINIAEASWAKTSKGQFKPGAYILTPQKTLAQQYMTDFEPLGLVELKGRTNYTCASWSKQMGDRVNCEDGASMNEAQRKKISDQDKNPSEEPDNFVDQNPSPEEPDDFVDQNPSPEVRCGSCPYRIAKDKFMHYPFGTTNFAYYLYESNLSGQLPRRNTLILDEAHNTEEQILGLTETVITQKDCTKNGVSEKLPIFKDNDSDAVMLWLDNILVPAISKRLMHLASQLTSEKNRVALDAARKKSALENFILRLNFFRYAKDKSEWFVWSDWNEQFKQGTGDLCIKPLTARLFAHDLLFSKAQKILITSATILDPNTFMRSLGIHPNDAEYLSIGSEFPIENRPLFYWPVGNMRQKDIKETLPKMAEEVEKILKYARYSTKKGIVHTQSYYINNYLVRYLRDRGLGNRIITHDSNFGAREEAQFQHIVAREKDPTILFSPSMTEGLDLREDLSRLQIVCKVPYPALTPYNKARMQRDPAYYQWQTALKLVQQTGRSNRSATDRSHTFILDSGFSTFIQKNNHILPKYWLDAIHW